MYITNLMRIYICDFPTPNTARCTTAFDVNYDMSIEQLKLQILDKYGIPCNQYYFTFNGKVINDERSFDSCGITDNAFVRFALRNIVI